jgi:arylsulfatase A-like enzyme
MRGQKGTPWLGGTRSSSFWRWPGRFQPADVKALAAHIDFLPTLAELAGVKLSGEVARQVEGRSLVPLLNNPNASWPDRTLVTHVGRWARFANPDDSKFTNCSVRTTRWHLVSIQGGAAPAWELFDLSNDPGEKTNVAAQHADVVKQMAVSYDDWWKAARAGMVNEKAVGPKLNPFKEAYWKQFGGGPTAEEAYIMEPSHKTVPGQKKKKG